MPLQNVSYAKLSGDKWERDMKKFNEKYTNAPVDVVYRKDSDNHAQWDEMVISRKL